MGSKQLDGIRNEGQEQLVIDMDLESILSKPGSWPDRCIYKVPRLLSDVNEEAYTPKVISIGPFHRDKKDLKISKEHKLRYLAEFCKATGKQCIEIWKQIEVLEERIRHCYEHNFDEIPSKEFIELMLLDSVFIIEYLLRMHERCMENDFLLAQPWLRIMIKRDLILLENQLPYFLIQNVYNFAFPERCSEEQYSFYFLACRFCFYGWVHTNSFEDNQTGKFCSCNCFSCLYCFWMTRCLSPITHSNTSHCLSCEETSVDEIDKKNDNNHLPKDLGNFEGMYIKFIKEQPKHLVDLTRKFLSCKHPMIEGDLNVIGNLPSATKLKEAGVTFKVVPQGLPLDIKFEKGALMMPKIYFHSETDCLFRNLMAFEQCHYPWETYLCNYIDLLNFLIDTKDDADVLVDSGIIIDWTTDRKVLADRVNKLSRGNTQSGSCYYDIGRKLNAHCNNPWYRTIATLRSVYFSNLWRGSGTIAALILLFLTLVQSIRNISRMF